MTATGYIAQTEKQQMYQLSMLESFDNFPCTLSIAEISVIRLLYMTGTLNVSHIKAIFNSIISETELNETISSLCEASYVWESGGYYYALGRKSMGLFTNTGRDYAKMSISESEKLKYYLKGGVVAHICEKTKLDDTKPATLRLQDRLTGLLNRPSTLARFGIANVYKTLEPFKTSKPYIEIFQAAEMLNNRKSELSGYFASLSKKVKTLSESDPTYADVLSDYKSFELFLSVIDRKLAVYSAKPLILASSDPETNTPNIKLITASVLVNNGIYITNCTAVNGLIHLTLAIFDNYESGIGTGLLFSRLCLAAALVQELECVRPIYRLITTNGVRGREVIKSVVDKCQREHLRYFPMIENQLKILEV